MKKNNLKKFCSLIMIMVFMIGHTMWPFLAYADDTSGTSAAVTTTTTDTVDTTTPPSDPVTPSDTVQSPDVPPLVVMPPEAPIITSTTVVSTDGSTTDATTQTPDGAIVTTSSTSAVTQTPDTTPVTITTPTTPVVDTQTPATAVVTSVTTGDAAAMANVINIVNTNIVNSSGSIVLSNLTDNVTQPIDVRPATTCTLSSCAAQDGITVNVADNGSIANTIIAQSTTGANSIDHVDQATITTGNAKTGVNLLNLANTNIINSNYLLALINAFGNVNSDIIFPGLQSFFSNNTATSPVLSTTANTGAIDNTVSVTADAGGNTIAGSHDAVIASGASTATASLFNELNTTTIGDNNLSLLFKIHGNWTGKIVGLPDTVSWVKGADGSLYIYSTDPASATDQSAAPVALSDASTAFIHNNVIAAAVTGNNAINDANTALIATGNATAGVNIANIANTTVAGRNWMLGITNIFGDFNGNIVFGRPDLWIGETATKPDVVNNGTEVTYTYTIKNNGDAAANTVQLKDTYDTAHMVIDDSSVPYTIQNGQAVFDLNTLAPNATTQVIYHAHVINVSQPTAITDTATLAETETDNNPADNTDTVTIEATPASVTVSGGSYIGTTSPIGAAATAVVVTRTTKDIIVPSDTHSAEEDLTIENTGLTNIDGVVLHDILRGPDNSIIHDDPWNIGTLVPHEEVDISYEIQFNNDATAGTYTLDTTIAGDILPKETLADNGTITLTSPLSSLVSGFRHVLGSEVHAVKTKTLPETVSLAPLATYAAGTQQSEQPITRSGYEDFVIPLSIILLIVLAVSIRKYYRRQH